VSVRIELGRARLRIADVLGLEEESVVQLDRGADDPVDVYVNDRLVARGEVIVLNDRFAIRLTEVVSPIADE
jgi:flagellar motor switch protein FliN/FliY